MRKKRMTRERREREMAEVLAASNAMKKDLGIGWCLPYWYKMDGIEEVDAMAKATFDRLEPLLGPKLAWLHVTISVDREPGGPMDFMMRLLFCGKMPEEKEQPGELLRLDDFRGLKKKKKAKKAA